MKTIALLLAAMPLAVHAQSGSVTPAAPETYDTVYFDGDSGRLDCPVVYPGGMRMEGQVIQIRLDRVGDCGFGPTSSFRVPLGRFPTGNYRVEVYDSRTAAAPNPAYTRTFSVGEYGRVVGPNTKPGDNYTGHWTVYQHYGEGFTMTQIGKTVFATFLFYGPDGAPTWYVIPDARYEYGVGPGFRYRGNLYAARGIPDPQSATTAFRDVTPIGTAIIADQGNDVAGIDLMLTNGTRIGRTILRMRF